MRLTIKEVQQELISLKRSFVDSFKEGDGVVRDKEAKRTIVALDKAVELIGQRKRNMWGNNTKG